MCIERGSTWNRWDFHLHTPYSILNNEFGFNIEEDHRGEHFDNFVKTLFEKKYDYKRGIRLLGIAAEKAVQCGIVAIGVTDYFSIDGYKRIREEYLSKPDKMRMLFPDDKLRKSVEEIFVFPNIEFRLNTFVGEKAHSVNYHVFFSDKFPVERIESEFLGKIEILRPDCSKLSLNRMNIEAVGRRYKEHNNATGNDYLIGLEKITVNYEKIQEVLMSNIIFKGKYFISVPVDEDLSNIQ